LSPKLQNAIISILTRHATVSAKHRQSLPLVFKLHVGYQGHTFCAVLD